MLESSSQGPLDPEEEDESDGASAAPAQNLNVNKGVQGGNFVDCDMTNTTFNIQRKEEREFSQYFQRIRPLGKGYFGTAWIVEPNTKTQQFIMKEISCSEKECLKTGKEIERLKKCLHENIICLIDSFYEQSKFLIIMEYCSGKSLAEFIGAQRDILHLDKILEWFRQLTSGVCCIHRMNIVYMHLKPANILLSSDNLKISNFGIAKGSFLKNVIRFSTVS